MFRVGKPQGVAEDNVAWSHSLLGAQPVEIGLQVPYLAVGAPNEGQDAGGAVRIRVGHGLGAEPVQLVIAVLAAAVIGAACLGPYVGAERVSKHRVAKDKQVGWSDDVEPVPVRVERTFAGMGCIEVGRVWPRRHVRLRVRHR
jgi:hypothetical protein